MYIPSPVTFQHTTYTEERWGRDCVGMYVRVHDHTVINELVRVCPFNNLHITQLMATSCNGVSIVLLHAPRISLKFGNNKQRYTNKHCIDTFTTDDFSH